jgi:hypothetical protein
LILSRKHLSIGFTIALVLAVGLVACSSNESSKYSGVDASAETTSNGTGGSPPHNDSGDTNITSEPEPDGAAGMGGGPEIDDATTGLDEASDTATGPTTDDVSDVKVPRGPGVLFSFDLDSDFKRCNPGVLIPPCWHIAVEGDAGGSGGTFEPVIHEAVVGHSPERALAWTATYPGYDARVRLSATLAQNEDWAHLTRLHIEVYVASGLSSVHAYQLFIQGGVETGYGSIYQTGLPDDLLPRTYADGGSADDGSVDSGSVDSGSVDSGSDFHDLSIDLTDPSNDLTVLGAVAGMGIVFLAESAESGAALLPTVVHIDNIWLE